MIKPIDKITSLVSNDLISLFGDSVINNSFEEAWKTTLGILTDDAIHDSLVNTTLNSRYYMLEDSQGVSSWLIDGFTKDKRLISVERQILNSSPAVYYPARSLDSLKAYNLALNSDSIYYENNKYLPRYFTTTGGQLNIIPKDAISSEGGTTYNHPKARIFWISMLKFNQNGGFYGTFDLTGKNLSDIDEAAEDTIFYGIPTDAKELVYLQTAINLIQNYMADFVHEEEDTELTTLLASQIASLNSAKQEQYKYILAKYGGDVQLNE